MAGSLKTWYVKLAFSVAGGHLTWASHVQARDKEGAVLVAVDWLKAQINFPQKVLPYEVLDAYEDEGGARPA